MKIVDFLNVKTANSGLSKRDYRRHGHEKIKCFAF